MWDDDDAGRAAVRSMTQFLADALRGPAAEPEPADPDPQAEETGDADQGPRGGRPSDPYPMNRLFRLAFNPNAAAYPTRTENDDV